MASRRFTLVILIAAFTLLLTLINYFYIDKSQSSHKSYNEHSRKFSKSQLISSGPHLIDEFSEQIEIELEQAANHDNLPDRMMK